MKRLNNPVTVRIKVPEINGFCHDKLAGSKSQKFCFVKERCGEDDDFWFIRKYMPLDLKKVVGWGIILRRLDCHDATSRKRVVRSSQ